MAGIGALATLLIQWWFPLKLYLLFVLRAPTAVFSQSGGLSCGNEVSLAFWKLHLLREPVVSLPE